MNSDSKLNEVIIGNSATEILKNLSDSQKLALLAKYYGFKTIPVSIDEFIEDQYYLGSIWNNPLTPKVRIYEFWRDKLREVYPNPILTSCQSLVLTGALGIGKSSMSKLIAAYDIYKFSLLESPYASFGLDLSTPFSLRCFNLTKSKAYTVLVDPLWEQINASPYFQEYIRDNNGLPSGLDIAAARKAGDVISECLIFALISEINFMPEWIAKEIMDTCLNRMSSRLQLVENVFGHILLDSSATGNDSITDDFMRNSPFASKAKCYRASIWEAKSGQGVYFKTGSFKVYAGSGEIKPHIIDEYEDTSDYDPDRIVEVPNELYANFKSDIIKALQDSAGISVSCVDEFYTDRDKLRSCFSIDNEFEDVYILDFYDNEQLYDIIGSKVRKLLPKDKKIYGRIDLGLVNDNCGISLGYVEDLYIRDLGNGNKVKYLKICSPVNFAISRKPDQETPIDKVVEFFIWLSRYYELGCISTDQFQSSSIRQVFELHKIPTRLLSVDRTNQAYTNHKNLTLKNHIKINKCDLLRYELEHLIRYGDKVDHPVDGSKDIADAHVGMCQTIIDDGLDAAQPSTKQIIKDYADSINQLNKVSKSKRTIGGLVVR